MKTLIVEMLQNKQLTNKKIDVILKSGKSHHFDLSTDNLDLCTGHDYIMFIQNERQYIINCKSVEMFIIS